MTDRQEATRKALQWAYRADRAACDYRATRSEELLERHAAVGQQARETSLMWASIARLLPAVLPETELEPEAGICDDERATLGALIRPARCILPTGHHGPHTDLTRSRWQALDTEAETARQHPDHQRPTPCSDRYWGTKTLAPKYCERTAGHRGVHSSGELIWGSQDQANAASPTGPSVPGQRKAVDDIELPDMPPAGACCQGTVVRVSELLLRHARTAPGLTNLERRCLEDAADYIRAHAPAATMPEPETPGRLLEPPSATVVLAARHLDSTEGIGRTGHTLAKSDVAALETVLRYVSRQHNAKGGQP